MNDFLKEKELLLDSIENNTAEHWKNYYKDVPIECIYDDLVIDINEIKRLQNNWNELKEYCLNEQIPEEYDEYNSYIEFSNSVYENVLNKMQELEQGKDES